MRVGNKVYLFRNTNLKGYNGDTKKWEYKDPTKGIVHSKREGVIILILQNGVELSENAIDYYAQGNPFIRKSFQSGSNAMGTRIVVEYNKGTRKSYGILREAWWTKANHKSQLGYAIVHSNAIDFITSKE